MLVSIITPAYNSARFIEETILSVINQSYASWEMIIVDDFSTDNTCEIIEEYVKVEPRIKLIKLPKNSGPAIARNKGIKEALGTFIAFLDSDDLWSSEKLSKQVNFMIKNNVFFSFCAYKKINEEGVIISNKIAVKNKITYTDLLYSNSIGCLTAMYNCSATGKFYMENVGHEDYTLWLKILKKITHAEGINEVMAYYRIRECSVSKNKLKVLKYQWRIYREIENLSPLKSVRYFFFYALRGLIKKYLR